MTVRVVLAVMLPEVPVTVTVWVPVGVDEVAVVVLFDPPQAAHTRIKARAPASAQPAFGRDARRRLISSLTLAARIAATASHSQGRGGVGARGNCRGVPPAVVITVTVAGTEFGAVTLTEVGKTVHDDEVIESEQVSDTAPLKPPWPLMLRL